MGSAVPAQGQFKSTTVNGEVTITSYTGLGGDVTIPDFIGGLPVTAIGDRAFQNKYSVTNLVVGNYVRTIGRFALSLPNLLSVIIPEGVTNIDVGAFADCFALQNITLPETLLSVGSFAFEQCSTLPSVTIPANVSSIGAGPFFGCTNLTEILVEPANAAYVSIEGVLFTIDQSDLIQYPAGKSDDSYDVPDGVTVIGSNAFRDARSLSSVHIPDTVTVIQLEAFFSCKSLRSVNLPPNLLRIENNTFAYCDSLESIFIPNKVTTIDNSAFYSCPSLQHATVGSGVTNIAYSVFNVCPALAQIYFMGDAPQLDTLHASPFDSPVSIYYQEGRSGWQSTFASLPTAVWNPLARPADPQFGIDAGAFRFNITGPDGLMVIIEASDMLSNPVWTAIATNTLSGGGSLFKDSEPANTGSRFYRFRSPN